MNPSARGASLTEYSFLVALIALASIVALSATGDDAMEETEYLAAVIEGEILDSDGSGFGGSSGSDGSDDGSDDDSGSINQSFENGTDRTTFYDTGDTLGIWTIAEGSVDSFSIDRPQLSEKWLDTGAQTPDGTKILDLNGKQAGAIETDLRVATGADYTLTFLASENHFCSGSTTIDGVARTGQVLWNGEVVQTFSVDTNYGEFEVVTAVLPAGASNVGTLRIESTMSGTCGPAIESASVTVALR